MSDYDSFDSKYPSDGPTIKLPSPKEQDARHMMTNNPDCEYYAAMDNGAYRDKDGSLHHRFSNT